MRKQDNNEYSGTIIFLVLFFIMFFAFNSKHERQNRATFHYQINTEFRSNIVATNDIHQPGCQNELMPKINIKVLKLFTEELKINNDNRLINQRIVTLQNSLYLFKPYIPLKFRYQYHYTGTETLPSIV